MSRVRTAAAAIDTCPSAGTAASRIKRQHRTSHTAECSMVPDTILDGESELEVHRRPVQPCIIAAIARVTIAWARHEEHVAGRPRNRPISP